MVGNFLNEKLEQSDVDEINDLYEKLRAREISSNKISNYPVLVKMRRALDILKHELRDRSRTAKLWLAYIEYVDTLKLFIHTEKTGDWNLHLVAVGKMMNLFAATGHSNFAKSARLYLQWMLELPQKHPWLYKQFSEHEFHFVRCSDRYWAGLSTDLIIEQVMMRSIKSRSGLTRGRGFTEVVRLMWVYSMHSCAQVHDTITSLIGLAH